jgi:hypothetical protein
VKSNWIYGPLRSVGDGFGFGAPGHDQDHEHDKVHDSNGASWTVTLHAGEHKHLS